ncbi:MAG: hypothetical protein O7G83_12220 [Proteobacteria bacterium]|nr:hypothetical protein [Pseudomonadota bacterium]
MSNRIKIPAATMVATIFVAAGCANTADQEKKELTVESVPSIASDLSSTPAVSVGTGMQRLVDIATADLTAKLGIEKTDIQVAEAGYVTWRDSSIGCPQPGMQYLQVITNGSRIVLKVNGAVYNYHSGGGVPPSYCPKPATQKPLPYDQGES